MKVSNFCILPGFCYECGIQAAVKCLQCVVLYCFICYSKVYFLLKSSYPLLITYIVFNFINNVTYNKNKCIMFCKNRTKTFNIVYKIKKLRQVKMYLYILSDPWKSITKSYKSYIKREWYWKFLYVAQYLFRAVQRIIRILLRRL